MPNYTSLWRFWKALPDERYSVDCPLQRKWWDISMLNVKRDFLHHSSFHDRELEVQIWYKFTVSKKVEIVRF
jgi:hypothetical protein